MWGRAAYRFSAANFQPKSREGASEDWPITYEELASYYDKVESYIGVFGSKENLADVPDGVFLPPPPPRCTELLVKRGCKRLGIPCIPARAAILTRPLGGRPACHYCGQCGLGCKSASNFSSSQVMIAPALATGRLTLRTHAMATKVLVAKNGKTRGVCYIDKHSGVEHQVLAKAVVLAASACESARLLLNSRSAIFPVGLANSSGVVGRYLTDTISVDSEGYFPQLETLPPHNHDGTGGPHVFIPWWKNGENKDFAGGYFVEFGGGPKMPCPGAFHQICKRVQGYGTTLKKQCRRLYGTSIYFSARGEMVPNKDSYCELDPYVTDEWGIPVLKFHFQWGENEIRMAKDMHQTIKNIIEAAGGRYISPPALGSGNGLSIGGTSYHEVGTVRMGKNPGSSVLNEFCQAHDVKNLFVVDGGCFPSHPEKPPTLSIMALSWRASEYLVEMSRKGNL